MVTAWVCIEESDLDPVMPAPSSDTKKGKHKLNSFNTKDDYYTILYYTALKVFPTPRALFTQPHELEPKELAEADTTTTETPQDNCIKSPLLTHPSSPNSPPVDAL